MAYSNANCKAMAIKHFLVSDHSEYEIYQMFAYPDFTKGFMETHFN
jgi:hypothetical protein